MTRNVPGLANAQYDIVVVGGGIYGACVAWDACLRGLSVALVEQGDFASGTSANSLKIIHGGFRYLQHGDFRRMRESLQEQKALMRIAPHLVHPLPVLIPTYGHGLRGREVFACALAVNDLVGFDRNRLPDPQKHIPGGRLVSRKTVLEFLPGIPERHLTGGGIFHDGLVHNSERLLLSFLHSAEAKGARIANYVKAVGLLKVNNQVEGVEALDLLSGERFPVAAKVVVKACGPWTGQTEHLWAQPPHTPDLAWVKAFNIVTRRLFSTYAVGLAARDEYCDNRALVNKGKRLLFIVPWRDRSLIGTAYAPYHGTPDQFRISEKDVQEFLEDINQAYPRAGLQLRDVSFVHGGLLPGVRDSSHHRDIQLEKDPVIHVQRESEGRGIISVVGVKLTTARSVAERVVDRVFQVLGKTPFPSSSSSTPLYGGDIPMFQEFLEKQRSHPPRGVSRHSMEHLVYAYGSSLSDVLKYLDISEQDDRKGPDGMAVLRAEVRHAVREEMAQRLGDVVFRRTELGTAGHPGDEALQVCAEVMSQEKGWNPRQTRQELATVNESLRFLSWQTMENAGTERAT